MKFTPAKSPSQKRLEEHIKLKAIQKKIMSNSKFRNQAKGRILVEYNHEDVIIKVLTEEKFNKPMEGIELKHTNLEKEAKEKLDIIDQILELGKKVNKEAYRELYEIGDRKDEDWGE